jgi:hypothetical protein
MGRLNRAHTWTPASAGVTVQGSGTDPMSAFGNCTIPLDPLSSRPLKSEQLRANPSSLRAPMSLRIGAWQSGGRASGAALRQG